MTTYAYYPGCSLETMAASYHVSATEVARRLGIDLVEIEDWNCCGATAYSQVDELLAQVLCARNLALVEQSGRTDVVAPCSACFKNLSFANLHMQDDGDLLEHMNYALDADGLAYSGSVRVHHLMGMLVDEVGIDAIRARVTKPQEGLRVAVYYGCQLVRPHRPGQGMQDVEDPRFFEDLMEAIGADVVPFPHRLRCCGGSLIVTSRKAALAMLHELLRSAGESGADLIVTACPLCQVNLELYQAEVNREFGAEFKMPVVYFTQLMGLALGASPKQVGIGSEIVKAGSVLACRGAATP
ncbi:MAG: CoB--CoM heterodisulfide reductase iron-sulfur subunit B family protein [Actinobacteria bacterium]|nr:CoB--CoM heterodisulfide reductase iron-sulfur subunit B family protein [Actinomycetota bacterium]